jgi:hypothetical protein
MYADAFIAPNNDIYLVYGSNRDTAGAVNDIGFARLAYEAGSDDWVVAGHTLVFDADATVGAFNAVIGQDDAFLWAGYRYYDGSRYSFRLCYSADDGNTSACSAATACCSRPGAWVGSRSSRSPPIRSAAWSSWSTAPTV